MAIGRSKRLAGVDVIGPGPPGPRRARRAGLLSRTTTATAATMTPLITTNAATAASGLKLTARAGPDSGGGVLGGGARFVVRITELGYVAVMVDVGGGRLGGGERLVVGNAEVGFVAVTVDDEGELEVDDPRSSTTTPIIATAAVTMATATATNGKLILAATAYVERRAGSWSATFHALGEAESAPGAP